MFKKIDPKLNLPEEELKVLKAWKENNTFKKTLEKKSPKGNFVFYEGPPTANGQPGIHHVEARSFKDLFCRYKTMQGYYVKRKAGWDTHGLPVELQVEKQLGISGKPQIENIVPGDKTKSIEKFNELCKQSV
ncbi:TPA: isoleucine--tRNA ligase, partial [Candidatus Nomurabacteria bacterium]|nr:isoleucine--tRNA ligase [Candidatus Nomurabacteria bacterium]